MPREATCRPPYVAQVRSCFPTYCRAARMADILDIINASPDIFDHWTRNLRCIANADQCQAVSVTVFEASRSPQAFRDAFVCFEMPEVGAKIVCQPEHREAICRHLTRRTSSQTALHHCCGRVRGNGARCHHHNSPQRKINLKKLEQVTIPVSTFDHPTQCSLQ